MKTNLSSHFNIKKIHFGFASAETESAQEPNLLLGGFYDAEGHTKEALIGQKFLFLGYKGSGKSAIGQRLRLLAENDPNLFVDTILLGDFPFSQFTRIVKSTGPTEQESHFTSVWTWILLLYLLNSYQSDEGAELEKGLSQAIIDLGEHGMLPTGELKLMVLKSVKKGLKGILPRLGEASKESSLELSDDEALSNVEILKDLATRIHSESRHILVIDGLDDILTQKTVQYNVLGALVLATWRLNVFLAQRKAPAKIVLLCRTDLFARLPVPNKNKIRQDSAVELDWYHDPRDPGESRLVKLANVRARLTFDQITSLFDYFPGKFDGKDTRAVLANHTRHTPRDFLRLLVHIQSYAEPGRVSPLAISKGLREYSIKYLLPEIHDELVGYVSTNNAAIAFALFGSLRNREFSLREVQAIASRNELYSNLELTVILDQMFQCSAVGNVEHGHFCFKFRNRDSSINFGEKMVFHPGLWKALNVADS